MISLAPVRILKFNANEEKGETARLSNFVGAIAVGDLMKCTLGPKGMDKMLVKMEGNDMTIRVSNDGATILRGIRFDNPVAKILVNVARTQDELVGDGTTTVVILTAELLRLAEKMISRKIHPQTIITGYRRATKIALDKLESIAFRPEDDNTFYKNLMNIARTTLSSKILNIHKEKFSKLAVEAVLRLKGSKNLDRISIVKIAGGSLEDSFLEEGFILDKHTGHFQPKRVDKAKICIANTSMDMDKPKCFGSRAKVNSITKLAELELAEKTNMKEKIDKIVKFGCNVFINRQQIYDFPEQLFSDKGIVSIELADFDGVERLASVTGGEILSTFDDASATKLGDCESVEEILIGEKKVLRFNKPKIGEACTIVIRGSTQQISDEAARALNDALCVLVGVVSDGKMLYGGGSSETSMALAVSREAGFVTGKESVAMDMYSEALLELPRTISDNAGFDSSFLLGALKIALASGFGSSGLDIEKGDVACMEEQGVIEPLAVKRQIINSTLEATELILRVDHIITCEPRKRKEDKRFC